MKTTLKSSGKDQNYTGNECVFRSTDFVFKWQLVRWQTSLGRFFGVNIYTRFEFSISIFYARFECSFSFDILQDNAREAFDHATEVLSEKASKVKEIFEDIFNWKLHSKRVGKIFKKQVLPLKKCKQSRKLFF